MAELDVEPLLQFFIRTRQGKNTSWKCKKCTKEFVCAPKRALSHAARVSKEGIAVCRSKYGLPSRFIRRLALLHVLPGFHDDDVLIGFLTLSVL